MVYGGTLDVVSGKLMVNREYVDISAISSSWSNYLGINGYTLLLPQMATKTKAIISSHFRTVTYADKLTGIATNTTHYIYFCNAANYGATINEFKQWLSDNNVDFVIELETPIEYQLTSQEITAFLSTNNVWTNIGSITIKIAEKGITAFELAPHT